MRAVRVHECGGPEVMKVEDNVPIPEPADNELLIQVKAAGVNPVDSSVRAGRFYPPKQPFTPGYDAAGIVEKVGVNVKNFKKGDRVFFNGSSSGTYAQYATSPEYRAFELPENVSFEQGAGLGVPYLTAYRTLFQLYNLQPHHTVFVHGASGAAGLATVQLARRHGVQHVVGTAGTEEAIKLLSDPALCGPDNVFNHRSPTYLADIKARFPKGFNIIVEMLANVNLKHDIPLIAPQGTIMIVGSRGIAESVDTGRILMTEANIKGLLLHVATPQEVQEAGKAVVESSRDGFLPIISKKYSLEEAPQAHHFIMQDSKTPGKIVLIP